MNTLLVTGGAGFIGSSFVELCLNEGNRVVVLDALTYAGHRENLSHLKLYEQDGRLQFVLGSITDGALVDRLLREYSVDGLLNFAAESHVDRSITGPGEFVQTNIVGTFTLLTSALQYWKGLPDPKKSHFRYLQVSTDEVFGSLGKTGYFTETTPIQPNSPYSASKASADHLVRAWNHTYGLPTLITNCSNNYGPRQFPEKLIPFMITCALQGKPMGVYGDGSNVRDWIHVEDHCRGIFLALTRGQTGGTYCFGGRAERNNLDVVKTLCKHLNRMKPRADGQSYEKQITFVQDRLGHDWRYAIDDALAETELGFKRKYVFESGLEATVQWYLDNGPWAQSVLAKKNK